MNIFLISAHGGTSGKEPICQYRRHKRCGFDPWVGKIPWRRAWQPTPVFLPGEFHGQRSLVGYSPWGCKELDMTGAIITHSAAEASLGNIVKGKGPTPNTLSHNLWELEPVMCWNKVSRQFLLYHSLRYTDLKTPHSWLLASSYTPPELGNSLLHKADHFILGPLLFGNSLLLSCLPL